MLLAEGTRGMRMRSGDNAEYGPVDQRPRAAEPGVTPRPSRGVIAGSAGRHLRLGTAVALSLVVAGCASFGEGVGRGVLSRLGDSPDTDAGACEITGAPFDGILAALQAQDGQPPIGTGAGAERSVVKVVIVHGIGSHLPGYSGRTVANLTEVLGLDLVAPRIKSLDLVDPMFPGESIGTLTAKRFSDMARERELIVYELTWSRISDGARAALRFDSSEVHARHRARMNEIGKVFANDVLVDPLVYVGAGREKILTAVRQSVCWAYSTDWDGFPQDPVPCQQEDPRFGSRLRMDRYYFVTHSLGSRIVLDALETTAAGIDARQDDNPYTARFRSALQEHTTTVFMLANQLPLLQAGFAPVPVTGQIAAFCQPGGPNYGQRMLARTRVVAFSDPNDLLSFPVPEDFVQYGVDSRLCPTVVNVSVNIARVNRLLGGDGFANPLTAHTEYNNDERVIGLMTGGLGQPETPDAVTGRCRWIRVEEALR